MRLKFLWAALLALPVLAASLLHGRPFIRCCATGDPSLTAASCDESACCPQEKQADTAKQNSETNAQSIDPDRQIIFKVEGLTCPAVNGLGCGHMLRGVLATLDRVDGVEASSANYTGTMIRISVSRASDRDKVAEGVHKVLTEGDRKAVPLAGVEFKRALDREAWRGTGRIGELSAIEFHTLVLHRIKSFAKGEKLGKEAADKLVTIAERQWERISKEARSDGATQPEEWANRCRKSLPVLLERANEFLTGEQVDRLKQTLTGPCRDQDRPEAPPAPATDEKPARK